jgi:hypothetical protein
MSGRVRKISPTPGFDPRTVQPVASRYTDYIIPVHDWILASEKGLASLDLVKKTISFQRYAVYNKPHAAESVRR